jgi:hypothetical protein
MVRGVFAITAAFALACVVNLSAFDGQHGHSGQHGNSASAHGSPSSSATGTATGTGTATTTKTTTSSATLSPVQQKVQSHTQLANKLQSRLPFGTNVVTAASGFRNLGQFVAAVNVSHNLGIPFTQLKSDMVQRHLSLGQSIQDLRPAANPTREVERAESQAKIDIDVETHNTSTKVTATKRTSGDK